MHSDWPDGVVTVAAYITDAQVVHHHQHKVGPSGGLIPAAVTPHQQEQKGKETHRYSRPLRRRYQVNQSRLMGVI